MRRNRLREKLAAGEPTLGTHLLSCWPTLVELIGASGQFDYVEFTAEYAPSPCTTWTTWVARWNCRTWWA